jgi:hypothetical protein
MYEGSCAATVAKQSLATANRTRPAPLRSVAMPAKAIAPAMPRDPPIKSARPKSPLWLSAGRGGKSGNAWVSNVVPTPNEGALEVGFSVFKVQVAGILGAVATCVDAIPELSTVDDEMGQSLCIPRQ